MNIRSFIGTACAAIAIASCLPASAQGTVETVTPNFNRAIPNVPGKSLVAVVVDYAPGGRERAALAWAETVTRVADTGVPDDEYQAARKVFDEREIVDLTIAIGLMNAYNRMAISFRNPPQAAL
ncbi:carboxymuconolactone decarboxylase family protein [Paraburkholderia terrae]|uniref:hypothetical protein n=1 Tax=Paraburkholderia terrae TaxID=311230 RepID=UPI0037C52D79